MRSVETGRKCQTQNTSRDCHARRKLKEVFDRDGSEIAAEGLRRIAKLDVYTASLRATYVARYVCGVRVEEAGLDFSSRYFPVRD